MSGHFVDEDRIRVETHAFAGVLGAPLWLAASITSRIQVCSANTPLESKHGLAFTNIALGEILTSRSLLSDVNQYAEPLVHQEKSQSLLRASNFSAIFPTKLGRFYGRSTSVK